jgi:hypothetical protein
MNDTELDLGRAMSTGWEAVRAYPGLAIGGFALYYAITMGLPLIPIAGFLVPIFISPPLAGGLATLTLNIFDRRDPQIAHLFDGFKAYGKWMGIVWLYYAIGVIVAVPLAVLGLVAHFSVFEQRTAPPGPAIIGGISFIAAVLVAAAVAVLIRWVFLHYAGVESPGTFEAYGLSSQVTRGRRLQLFWMSVVLGLIAVSGVIALGVGLLVTLPLGALAMAALYRQLRPAPLPQPAFVDPIEAPVAPEYPSFETPNLPESQDRYGQEQ